MAVISSISFGFSPTQTPVIPADSIWNTPTVLPSDRCPTAADPKLMRSMGTTSPGAPEAHGAEAGAVATSGAAAS